MSPIRSGSYDSDAIAERRAQRVLNEKVGDRLPERRGWAQRLLGTRGQPGAAGGNGRRHERQG